MSRSVYSGNYVRCKHCDHKFRAIAPDFPEPARSEKESAGPLLLDDDESDRFNVNCPTCTATLSVRRAYAGQYVRCRKCNSNFLVPNIIEAPKPERPKSAEPDLFDQLYKDIEETPSGEQAASEPGPAAALPEKELAAIAEQVNQLLSELESLREERDRIESERISALAQIDELRAERDRQSPSWQRFGNKPANRPAPMSCKPSESSMKHARPKPNAYARRCKPSSKNWPSEANWPRIWPNMKTSWAGNSLRSSGWPGVWRSLKMSWARSKPRSSGWPGNWPSERMSWAGSKPRSSVLLSNWRSVKMR